MLPGGRGGEFIIVAAIALIVVGPKDLPKLLRQLGRFVGKMRAMADDFRSSFEDMARQSELDDLRKEVEAMRAQNTPLIGDVKSDIHAFDSDMRSHMALDNSRPAVMTALPEPTVSVAPESIAAESVAPKSLASDPQMEGLPPKGVEAPPVTTPKPRKPRSPKAVLATASDGQVTAEAPVAEPKSPGTKKSGSTKSGRTEKAAS